MSDTTRSDATDTPTSTNTPSPLETASPEVAAASPKSASAATPEAPATPAGKKNGASSEDVTAPGDDAKTSPAAAAAEAGHAETTAASASTASLDVDAVDTEVSDEDPEEDLPATFAELGVPENLLSALDKMGWSKPTAVQCKAYSPLVEGEDLLVQSHTGSGKTGAFCLPWLAKFEPGDAKDTGVQLIVILPTRELAKQVCVELTRLAGDTEVKVLPVYGGTPMVPQLEDLKAGVHAVVGTPGRVLDHIRRRSLDLSKVKLAVLDECDEMLSMGFLEDIRSILSACPKERQTCLFSATVPKDIQRIAERYMHTPKWITLSTDQISAAAIDHAYYVSNASVKTRDLLDMIMVEQPGFSIVFCNTREETRFVAGVLRREGFDAEDLSSDLAQSKRERVLQRMRDHKLHFLVATDIAARGIDISHVSHVINYSFPDQAESYVHRTGRTGRAGRAGLAISLIGASEIGNFHLLKKIYKTLNFVERKFPDQAELNAQRVETRIDTLSQRFSNPVSPEWTLIARHLVNDPRGESVLAYLLSEAGAPDKAKRREDPSEEEDRDQARHDRVREERHSRGRGGERSRGRETGRGRGRDSGRERSRGRDSEEPRVSTRQAEEQPRPVEGRTDESSEVRRRNRHHRRQEELATPTSEAVQSTHDETGASESPHALVQAKTSSDQAHDASAEASRGAEADQGAAQQSSDEASPGRKRRRRRRKRGDRTAEGEVEARDATGEDVAADTPDDQGDDSERTGQDEDATNEDGTPKKRRRRRRRRGKRSGEAVEGVEAKQGSGDDASSQSSDKDDAGDEGAKRRKRRRRRGKGRGEAEQPQSENVEHEVVEGGERPKVSLAQSDIVIDLDESELEEVRAQFGDVDEFSDLTLKGRRRDVMDELRAEMVIEDVSKHDESDDDDDDDDDEGTSEDLEDAAESSEGVDEPASDTKDGADADAPERKRKRRRRRKKKDAPPPPPELTAPPHKDFWEVWSQKFTIEDFGLAAAADDAAIEQEEQQSAQVPHTATHAEVEADDDFVRVRLNIGRKHGQKSADIRAILRDRAELSGRTVRDLTVRTASTLLRINRSRVEALQEAVRGFEVADTLLEVTLAPELEEEASLDPPAATSAPAEATEDADAASEQDTESDPVDPTQAEANAAQADADEPDGPAEVEPGAVDEEE